MNRILILITLLVGFVACDVADEYEVSSGQRLRFSADTLAFDTLFASTPSFTRTLIVFNDGDKGLRISRVSLERWSDNPFRINVDGESLTEDLYDLRIAGGDSIFVFAEMTMPDTPNATYADHENAMIFTLENGVTHRVPLTSTSYGAEIYDEPYIVRGDTTFTADRVRVYHKSLMVDAGATLRIAAGTTLYFSINSGIDVRGTLICDGDSSAMVTLRGDRLDRLFPYLPYDNTTGRWQGVWLHDSSHDNVFRFTDMHSGAYGIIADTTDITMDACVIHNIGGNGLRLLSSTARVTNTQLTNTHGHCAAIYGGEAQFTFVTMAQYYPWAADRGSALFIADRLLDIDTDVREMNFSSCLITGHGDDVLGGDFYDPYSAPYMFNHCVLRTPVVDDDSHYRAVTWELAKNDKNEDCLQGSQQFLLFDLYRFLFDFTPQRNSISRTVADPADVARFPYDPRGIQRTDSVSAGCYEWHP